MEIVFMLLMGAVAGWLGSEIFKGGGLGLFGNVIVGILGTALGYWLFGELHITFGSGTFSTILTGALSAVIILFIVNLLFSGRRV